MTCGGVGSRWIAGTAVLLVMTAVPVAAQETAAGPSLEVRAISTRAEAVSGGDVLVQIAVPRGVVPERVGVTLNGRDVRSAFKAGPQPTLLIGLLTGLASGSNRLDVSAPGQRRTQLALTNHPRTGPVIAGPHQTPFVCETEAFGLGKALDTNCSVETRVEYFYRARTAASAQLQGSGRRCR